MKSDRLCSSLIALALLAAPGLVLAADEPTDPPPAPPPENWQPAGEVTPPAPTAAAEPKRPLLPSPLFSYGPFELDLHGRLQVLAGLVGDDANVASGDVLSRDGFRIRRARLGVSGRVTESWLYSLELDLIDEDAGGNALIEAAVTWKPCEQGWIKAGAFKPGYSRTLMTSTGDMQFLERPVWVNLERATDTLMLDLDHQVGLAVGGQVSLFSYQVGVYNGSRGFSTSDWNDGLLYVLRLGVGMGELGPAEADLERSGELRWSLGLNGYLNQDAAAEFRGAGVDLAAKWHGASLRAEALWAKGIPNESSQAVDALIDEAERWGMLAQVGYLLPFDFIDLELAVRFAILDDQVHIDDEGDLWELAAGVNLYLHGDLVKIMLHYVLREELHGADLSNDMLAAMLQLKF